MNHLKSVSKDDIDSKSAQLKLKDEKKEKEKQEKELKKIAKQLNQKRDHLKREEKFTEVSKQRGWDDWQSWCEAVKIDELKNELNAVSKSVFHLMDNTEKVIETIQTHRKHADEQYSRNFQAYSELIDYIMNLYNIFKDSAHQMYEQEREHLVAEFFQEALNRESVHHRRETFYENLADVNDALMKCDVSQMDEQFIERNVEIESDSFIKREAFEKQAKKREAIACSEVRNLVNAFNKIWWPKSRYNQYKETLKKSVEVDKLIDELREKIEESLKTISKLEKALKTCTQECGLKMAELRSEHRFMSKVVKQVEEKVKQESLRDHEKLINLVSICEKTKKKLREFLNRGRTIQSAMRVCKKFEKLSDELESSESSEDSPSEILFRKLSRVEAQCVILRNFKANLKAKNEKLEHEIKIKTEEFQVKRNISILRLDTSPSVGEIWQISNQIPQISSTIIKSSSNKLEF